MKILRSAQTWLTGLAAICTLLIASTVYAQQEEEPDNRFKIEEVVVTAQKRSQSLLDVPITVNALSEENLKDFGVDTLFEVANIVPGMVFSRAPDDGLALTLRGLGTPARTQSFDQSVALFQDGMFVGKGRMYSSAFFDVSRLEVIKGTQSTLLGKNTSLGAISVITKKPGDGANIRVSGELENGGYTLDGGVDFRATDELSFRLAGHYLDEDGWVKNTLTGEDVPADKEFGLRLTTLYEPSDVLVATLILQITDSERTGNGFQFVDNGDFFTPDFLNHLGEANLDDKKAAICPECPGGESFHDTQVKSAVLNIEYEVGALLLTSVTSYASYDLKFFDDFDFGAAFDEVTFVILNPGTVTPYSTYFQRDEDYDQFSQELRLTSPEGKLVDYMVGLFYFESDWTSSEQQFWRTPNFPPPPPPPPAPPGPPGPPSGNLFNGPFTNNFTQDTQTISAFAQVTVNFTNRLRGTLGLRYTDEKKDVVFQRIQGTPVTIWNTVTNPPFNAPLTFDDDFLNGNFNIQFDLSDDAMAYASYGVGSKTGGFAESAEVGSGDPALDVAENGARVKTEEAATIEAGIKMRLLQGAANLNIAVFSTKIDNFQETSFQVLGDQAFFLTRNIDAESKGVEVDGLWQINNALRLIGGVTYADSTNAGDGSKLAQAPEVTGSAGLLFEKSITSNLLFSVSGFARYRDKMFSQISETFPSDSLTSFDMTLSLGSPDVGWKVSLIGTNITDEVATDFSGPPAAPIGGILMAPPGDRGITAEAPSSLRSIRIQAEYQF